MSSARHNNARRIQAGGALFLLAGIVILMGIITAETQYPVELHYSTRANEISNLGEARPGHGVSAETSAVIFDSTMVLTGAMILAGAVLSHQAHHSLVFSILILLLGVGVVGVGLFPENHHQMHKFFSMVIFLFGGLSAAFSAIVTRGAFRYIALLLGLTSLICFAIGMNVLLHLLGPGGTERWVAYPIVLWLNGYGGYVLAGTSAGGE